MPQPKIIDPTKPEGMEEQTGEAGASLPDLPPVLDANARRIVITMTPQLQGDRVTIAFEGFAGVPDEVSQFQVDTMLMHALGQAHNLKVQIFQRRMQLAQQQQQETMARRRLETGRMH